MSLSTEASGSNLRRDSLVDIMKDRGGDTCVGEYMGELCGLIQNLGSSLDCDSQHKTITDLCFCLRGPSDRTSETLSPAGSAAQSPFDAGFHRRENTAADFTNQQSQISILQT